MPLSVFIAFAIFSLPGGLRDAWISKERVDLLSLGLTTLAEGGGVPSKIRHRTGDLSSGQ
jgi:hypothetical protein